MSTGADFIEAIAATVLARLEPHLVAIGASLEELSRDRRQLKTFAEIAGWNADRARMFLRRHPEISKLGVRVGRSLMFDPPQLLAALGKGR